MEQDANTGVGRLEPVSDPHQQVMNSGSEAQAQVWSARRRCAMLPLRAQTQCQHQTPGHIAFTTKEVHETSILVACPGVGG